MESTNTKTENEKDEKRSIALIKALEKAVGIDKGKGKFSKSIIKTYQLTSPKELEISLKSKELEPPHLRIMYNPDESLHGIYIVGDGDYIDAGDIVLDALVTTIAVYYVFDLDYPDIFSQILGILQQYVVKDVYTGRKGSKYVRFSKWISGKMSE